MPVRQFVVFGLLSLAAVTRVHAQGTPLILRTSLDAVSGVLTITGTGLGPEVAVMVDGLPAALLPGATDTEIHVAAPDSVRASVGAFRVLVGDPRRGVVDGFVVLSPGDRPAGPMVVTRDPTARHESGAAPASADAMAGRAARPVLADPNLIENSANTAVGLGALVSATTGYYNAALGYNALNHNTSGIHNTASGAWSLYWNSSGSYNTATGEDALWSNTNGNYNTATGKGALYSVAGANYNTGTGYQALYGNVNGYGNTAVGANALVSNTFGGYNAAVGLEAAYSNTGGQGNTAVGWASLYANSTGGYNTAAGLYSLRYATGSQNTALGFQAGYGVTTGSHNVLLGAGVTGTASDANTMRLGLPYDGTTGTGQNRTFIAGIFGTQLTAPAQAVFVDANGQLGIVGPQVQIGGGTIGPGAVPREVETLTAEVRAQRETIAALEARLRRLEAALGAAARRR
ncbi:MAG: hypothetical protein AB7O28_03255 [Vicinamibacterales bacterium]